MNQLGTDIRKIIGLDDELAELKKMVSSAPIRGRVGQAYENGFSHGNGAGDGDYGKDGNSLDDKTSGAGGNKEDIENGNDTSKGADEELKVGDLLDKGLGGLFDCETGACINVNFNQDYQRKPKGWESQCEPPKGGETEYNYYYEVSHQDYECRDDWRYPLGDSYLKNYTHEQFQSYLNSYPQFPLMFTLKENRCVPTTQENDRTVSSFGRVRTLFTNEECRKCDASKKDSGMHHYNDLNYARRINGKCQDCGDEKITEYPPEKCSEIQTTKLGTAFEAACPKYDKRLPKRFQEGRFSSIELCDKDGNKVEIKRTIRGFEIKQDKYGGRTTIVDSNNYKVVGYN